MTQIDSVVSQLQAERKQLAESLSRVDQALQLLRGSTTQSGRRSLSASARARIAAAQRAHWAKWKKGKKR